MKSQTLEEQLEEIVEKAEALERERLSKKEIHHKTRFPHKILFPALLAVGTVIGGIFYFSRNDVEEPVSLEPNGTGITLQTRVDSINSRENSESRARIDEDLSNVRFPPPKESLGRPMIAERLPGDKEKPFLGVSLDGLEATNGMYPRSIIKETSAALQKTQKAYEQQDYEQMSKQDDVLAQKIEELKKYKTENPDDKKFLEGLETEHQKYLGVLRSQAQQKDKGLKDQLEQIRVTINDKIRKGDLTESERKRFRKETEEIRGLYETDILLKKYVKSEQ